MTRFLSCWLLLLLTNGLFGQTGPSQWLEAYRAQLLPEKIFVHTDKSIYAGGEDLWAAVYLVNGMTHRPDSLSRLIHLELRDNKDEVILRRKLYPFDGHIAGDFQLPATLVPGEYKVVAYTNYQLNSGVQSIFRKAIRVVSGLPESGGVEESVRVAVNSMAGSPEELTLRFFPEGGHCVDGITCRVAVVASGADGSPRQVNGFLTNASGEQLKSFSTAASGVGTFIYRPLPGDGIRAVAGSLKQEFALPDALSNGLHLRIKEVRDTISILVSGSSPELMSGSRVLLHLRGLTLMDRVYSGTKSLARFLLPCAALPPGVITATVFDRKNEPLAERLFFIPPRAPALQINTDAGSFETRAPVKVTMDMPQGDLLSDSVMSGRVSYSVLPMAAAGGPSGDDIRTWLLLNSDLDRPIPDAPELLFGGDAEMSKQRIEDYLLTRGWRRFKWEAISAKAPTPPEHDLERGLYLKGRMAWIDNHEKARPGKVFLSRLENAYSEEQLTDEEGYFSFGPFVVFDTLPVAIQGRFKWGKKNWKNERISLDDNNNVYLYMLDKVSPPLPELIPATAPAAAGQAEGLANYQELSRKSLTVARTYDSLIIDLDVIDVVTKRVDAVEEARDQRTTIYGSPDDRVIVADYPGAYAARTFLDLLRTVSGVSIIGEDLDAKISIRGLSSLSLPTEPAFFLDGQQVTLEVLLTIPVLGIEFIDVLKGSSTAAFGLIGANGVILVYTRNGTGNVAKEPGLLNTSLNGFQKVREFAQFDASLPENRNRPDIRTTLYWQPMLRTDARGQLTDTFSSSDQKGTYIIVAQGLRQDGRPYYGTSSFEVK